MIEERRGETPVTEIAREGTSFGGANILLLFGFACLRQINIFDEGGEDCAAIK